ncbi:helix-turn-helix domain-containing protein [Dictyobacter formicarum]|uniref:HTH cro/C1-type domain-containing protein n=1 Tax=Dictyobacter formicarum TaxID=2778368 RepID=A0ABQ3VQI2_9CHLR|nr:ImmA/IrrE family metallo-endopeptidase [Dictyobacter formicarum]GHO88250.1 hypothetical protein KSZ_62560 [Dictyobacter formicarum]
MTSRVLDTIDPITLGKDLQKARKRKGLTQEEAAKIIDAARTTITAIESGFRRIKPEELQKLARAYDCEMSDLVRPHPEIEPFEVQFRGPAGKTKEDEIIAPLIEKLEWHCQNYLELEQLLEAPLDRKYPDEYSWPGVKVEQAAEATAIAERQRLGLGDSPLPTLRDILEQDVGLRIFYMELPQGYSAMYFYTNQLGGCIAVNKSHPEDRRRWSLAHDYGHFLAHRYKPTISIDDFYQRLPESERFADAFAGYFLMPTSSLMKRFSELRRPGKSISLTDLGNLAYAYGVSIQALVRRLEDMKLLPTGMWEGLQQRGLKVRELQNRLGIATIPGRDSLFPLRYTDLAFEALSGSLIAEGRFARLLNVDRLQATKIAQELEEHMNLLRANEQMRNEPQF